MICVAFTANVHRYQSEFLEISGMSNNYYEILGVSSNASPAEIQSAYRRAAIQNHPDRGGDHSKMILINEAYGILSEPELRAEYDRLCRNGAAIEPGSTWWARTEPVRTAAAAYPSNWADFEKWASHFAADVSNAKYGKQYLWYGISLPTIEGSSSGVVFCVIGAVLGVLIIGVYFDLYPSADRVWRLKKPSDAAIDSCLKAIVIPLHQVFVLLSPILLGSWAGYFAHRWVHSLVTQPATGIAPDSPAPTHSVLVCNGCGQKVRVPRLDNEIIVTCPKCRSKFAHRSTEIDSHTPEHSGRECSVPLDARVFQHDPSYRHGCLLCFGRGAAVLYVN